MEEDRSGDHITAELGIGRKSDALSPIFMGKLPPVPKDGSREENLWGSRRKRRGIGKLGSLGGRPSACQIDGEKHVGLAATGCRDERN